MLALVVQHHPWHQLFGVFRKPRHEFEWIVRGGGVEVPCVWCLVLIPMIQVITLLVSVWFLQNAAGNVGHLLGMLCGLAIVLLLPKRISMRQPQFAGIL